MPAEEPQSGFEVGSVQRKTVAPIDMERMILGPFKQGEVPRLSVRYKGVEPKGSLVCHKARLDEADKYKLVFNFQNFGIRAVEVTVRRIG